MQARRVDPLRSASDLHTVSRWAGCTADRVSALASDLEPVQVQRYLYGSTDRRDADPLQGLAWSALHSVQVHRGRLHYLALPYIPYYNMDALRWPVQRPAWRLASGICAGASGDCMRSTLVQVRL